MDAQGNEDSVEGTSPIREASVQVPVPALNPDLYRYSGTNEILTFLIDRPFDQYSYRKLASIVGVSHATVGNAVRVLEDNHLVEVESAGNKHLVCINRDRIQTPENTIHRIPQSEFQEPTKEAIESLREELTDVLGVIVYGSVARGDADRRSDIDLWVLVRTDRSRNQSRATDVAKDLAQQDFAGNRYSFHITVESPESVPAYTEDIASIVTAGIPVHRTPDFEKFRSLMEGMIDGR